MWGMSDGVFSSSLSALQLQLTELLEGVGGKGVSGLLDQLAQFGKQEQEIILKVFGKTLSKVLMGEHRVTTQEDQEANEFVDSLYQDILKEMGFAENGSDLGASQASEPRLANSPIPFPAHMRKGRKDTFAVLSGGRDLEPLSNSSRIGINKKAIDFSKARKERLNNRFPIT